MLQEELKFELCNVLYSVFTVVGEVSGCVLYITCYQRDPVLQALVRGGAPWIRDIAAGLYDILSSKISQFFT